MAAVSLIVIASGPERLVERARAAAARHASPATDVVVVTAGALAPGAARNAGVRRSAGDCFLIVDGSDELTDDFGQRRRTGAVFDHDDLAARIELGACRGHERTNDSK